MRRVLLREHGAAHGLDAVLQAVEHVAQAQAPGTTEESRLRLDRGEEPGGIV